MVEKREIWHDRVRRWRPRVVLVIGWRVIVVPASAIWWWGIVLVGGLGGRWRRVVVGPAGARGRQRRWHRRWWDFVTRVVTGRAHCALNLVFG